MTRAWLDGYTSSGADDERNRRQQFDEDVQGGPRGILEWIAHGVATTAALCVGLLCREITGLIEFLGVVPGSAPCSGRAPLARPRCTTMG